MNSHLHFNLVSMILFSELQRINEARPGGIDLSFQLLGILRQEGHMLKAYQSYNESKTTLKSLMRFYLKK